VLLAGTVPALGQTSGQTKDADANYGTVYIYGNHNSSDGPTVTVTCDGRDVAQVSKNRFFVLHLPPGKHEIDAWKKGDPEGELRNQLSKQFWGNLKSGPSTAQLNVDAGATYYVSISRLAGATDIYEERTPDRLRTGFTKVYFWEAKVQEASRPEVRASLAKALADKGYHKRAEEIAGPVTVQYYCDCKPIDAKWVIDKQVVVVEPK